MKTNYLLLLLFALNISYAQFTAIPDPNFEQALIDLGIDDVMDGQIFNFNSYSVTSLDLSNREISDLTGINAFYSLQSLDVHSNNLQNLDVSNNVDLTELFCFANNLSNLTLSSSIVVLNANNNNLSTIDLSSCHELEEVFISHNQIESINTSENPFLVTLSASSNNITSVNISNNLGLENLLLHINPIVNIELSTNSNLRHLRLDFTSIHELDLVNNSLLNTLYIPNNPQFNGSIDLSQNIFLTDFYSVGTPLSCVQVENATDANNGNGIYDWWEIDDMSTYAEDCYDTVAIPDSNFEQALIDQGFDDVIDGMVYRYNIHDVTTLFLTNYGINDPTGIEGFKSLTFLQASGNNFTTIDLSTNLYLENLNLDSNELDTLNLSANTVLNVLRCSNNNITTLDLSVNSNLETLFCHSNVLTTLIVPESVKNIFCLNNQLGNVELDHCINLESLVLNNNLLTSINVLSNLNLQVLDVQNNLLENLQVFTNAALLSLNVSNNSISEIDVSICAELEELRMNNNLLETIDLSSNVNLEILDLRLNNLTTIDVSQNLALQYLLVQLNPNLYETIDLQNNATLTTVNLTNTNISCIKVNDAVAANNSQGIYTNWTKPPSANYTETTCDVLGEQENIDEDDLQIYPNPASDYLNISISNSAYENSILGIQIIDVLGKIVYNSVNYIDKINVQSLAEGIYVLQIRSSYYAVETRKIIIK